MQYPINRWLLLLSALMLFQQNTTTRSSAPPVEGIRTSGQYTVGALVKDIFAKGACDNISNIRAIGNPGGRGYFENGKNIIGMERGIIIATGPIENASGPNEVGDKSGSFEDVTGDPDLGIMSTNRILDAVGIEFDFVPLDSFVRFRYVFASEEYCEFVGSVYNDVFGFFVSGPGIQGTFSRNSQNVALIPGTNANVAINSVNHRQNADYFIRNELKRDAEQCGITPINSPYREIIEYDGFTKILTANLQLIPCETYHIRFVVSDVADRHYDSAVFLEAESFNIGGTVLLNATANAGTTATEGCENSAFVFERGEKENIDKALTVQLKIAAESTAIEGIDFQALPRTVTIPAGEMSVRLPVSVMNDGIAEPTEKLSIDLDIPCACYSGMATLTIADAPALQVQMPNAYACRGASTILTPQITGGMPPYKYVWNNGGTTPSFTVNAGTVGNYSVTVSDQCGNSTSASNQVIAVEPPRAQLSGFAEICAGDTAALPVNLIGTPPWRITYSVNGVTQPTIENIRKANFNLPGTLAGIYIIEKIEDSGCSGIAEGTAQVNRIDIQVDAEMKMVSCNGKADGSIKLTPRSGYQPFKYEWDKDISKSAEAKQLRAGAYRVTVTDAKGCKGVFAYTITEPSALSPIIFDCKDLADPNFIFSATGGTPPYHYSLDGNQFANASIFKTFEPGKSVPLIIQDAAGCKLEQNFMLPPIYEKMVELPMQLELSVGDFYDFQPKLNISEQLITNIIWTSGEGLSCNNCLQPRLEALYSGVYTIEITDIFGCVGEASVNITLNNDVDIFMPSAFSPNGDHLNDFFTVYVNENQVKKVNNLLIFDRWGNLVFAKNNFLPNDERDGWDGLAGDQLLDVGVYIYVVRLQLRDGSETIRKGQVVLMR